MLKILKAAFNKSNVKQNMTLIHYSVGFFSLVAIALLVLVAVFAGFLATGRTDDFWLLYVYAQFALVPLYVTALILSILMLILVVRRLYAIGMLWALLLWFVAWVLGHIEIGIALLLIPFLLGFLPGGLFKGRFEKQTDSDVQG